MKKIIITLIAVALLLSCKKETKIKTDSKLVKTESFDWLLGSWIRNNDKEDEKTYEIWEKKNNFNYQGIGFTLKNKDTIKQEKMKLLKSKSNWQLQVIVLEEDKPVIFKMTSFTATEFICENPALEFPKKIKYWQNEDKLNALVSGDDLKIPFEFEKHN